MKNKLWWQKGVIYQIYPRSFMDSNGDGIGDIKGIISKLDYLNDGTEKSLGVDAIWISPIYKSPMKDFGYDISDYEGIDKLFGTKEEFLILLDEAHKRGIKVIMDLVVNHSSDKHPWFIESKSSKNSDKRDWYIWYKKKPNNWFSEFSFRSSWVYHKETDEYYHAYFTKEQPELNWRNKDVKEAVYKMIRNWFDLGIDGFRIDVVNYYIKDDQYRNNPWKFNLNPIEFQEHIYDRNRPENHEITREMRKIADEYNEKMYIGEVFTSDSKIAVSYHGENNDELHLAFNFNFLFQKWDAKGFLKKIKEWYDLLPQGAWPNFTLSNHDQPRHFSRYDNGSDGEARAKVAAAMLLTLKGTPTIYYGEEIGMENIKIKRKYIKDPIGLKYWPFHPGRDGERTPMQWTSQTNSGFTTGKPWLQINPNYIKKNVELQNNQENSLLTHYKKLIWLRKQYLSLAIGELEFLDSGENGVLSYKRVHGNKEIFIFLNFINKKTDIEINQNCKVIYGTHRKRKDYIEKGLFDLNNYEVIIMEGDKINE